MNQKFKKIALVGMPNNGKSTLFNKLCGRHISTSFDEDGTTVDYISYTIKDKIIVDTCGINKLSDFDDISGKYIIESDLILYVIDGRSKPTNMDIEFCRFLKKQKKIVWLVCNKCETDCIPVDDTKVLIYDKLFITSAEHNLGIENLKECLDIYENEPDKKLPLIAIIGRANCGKSTLMNCLVGYDRVKVEDKIGTTRDNIVCQAPTFYNTFNFMDTAGYRKETCALEYITKKRREHSFRYIDGAILVTDGQLGLTKTDKQILDEIINYAKFVIICINKSDVLNTDPIKSFEYFNTPECFPMLKISAKNNDLGQLKKVIDACYANIFKKIGTPELNKLLKTCGERLRCNDNKPLKIKYIFQKSVNPMEIGYFSNKPMSKNSIAFFSKNICDFFNLNGVNIKFVRFMDKKD